MKGLNFKNKLIKFLGGYTAREYIRATKNSFELGRNNGENRAAAYLVTYAQSIYGDDNWEDKVYKRMTLFLNGKINKESLI